MVISYKVKRKDTGEAARGHFHIDPLEFEGPPADYFSYSEYELEIQRRIIEDGIFLLKTKQENITIFYEEFFF